MADWEGGRPVVAKKFDDEQEEVDDWEKLLDSDDDEADKKPSPALKKANGKPAAKAAATKPAVADFQVPLDDPVAEKLRLKKLEEERDRELIDDLFDGSEPAPEAWKARAAAEAAARGRALVVGGDAKLSGPLECLNLTSIKDVETFAEKLAARIASSQVKSPTLLRFFDLLLKDSVPKMDLKDIKTLRNKVDVSLKEKEKQQKIASSTKKKPGDFKAQARNYEDEMDIYYGAGQAESDYEDDYGAFM